jgi:hypothetical protein
LNGDFNGPERPRRDPTTLFLEIVVTRQLTEVID